MNAALKPAYFQHVDGMRALAVLAVVFYHLNPAWVPGGFAGVDVFFVISGFVVTSSVSRLNVGSFWQFLLHFYARRIQRIVPALMLCLVVTFIFSALLIPSAWLSNKNQSTGLAAFFGFSNFVLARSGNDYFSPTAEFNPYTHTWSLGVEEQFYLLFPMMFFPWLAGGIKRQWSIGLFAGGAVLSLLLAWYIGQRDTLFAFYTIVTRFWELATGVLLYQCVVVHRREGWKAPLSIAWVGASLVLLGLAFTVSQPADFPFPGALPAVLGTLGLLYALSGTVERGITMRLLTSAPAVFVGKISYSLYLWHWPVFVLFKWTVGTESLVCRVAALLLAATLAVLSYYLVESRIRHSPLVQRTRRSYRLAGGVALICVSFSVSAVVLKSQSRISLSTVSRHAAEWDPHLYVARPQASGCSVTSKEVTSNGSKVLLLARSGCDSAPAANRLFVAGDSHAGHYNLMLREFTLQTGVPVSIYTTGGCALLGLRKPMELEQKCQASTTSALLDISQNIHSGDMLILSSLRLPRFGDQWAKFDENEVREEAFGAQAAAQRKAAEEQAITVLAPFVAKGVKVVFTAPTPVFRSPAFRCSDWFNRSNPICADGLEVRRSEIEKMRLPVLESLARITRELPSVRVWDTFPMLCSGSTCQAERQGVPLFFDGDHLSARSNDMLLPGFTQFYASVYR